MPSALAIKHLPSGCAEVCSDARVDLCHCGGACSCHRTERSAADIVTGLVSGIVDAGERATTASIALAAIYLDRLHRPARVRRDLEQRLRQITQNDTDEIERR
jgi:hypothetical protein